MQGSNDNGVGGCSCDAGTLDTASQTIISVALNRDPRSEGMMPGWAIEVARQKLLFFTKPSEFPVRLAMIANTLDSEFNAGNGDIHMRCFAFMLGVADSLNSVVEMHHNLQKPGLHGGKSLSNAEIETAYARASGLVLEWEKADPQAARAVLDCIKTEDMAANKGDNLFIAWANNWQKDTGVEPYANAAEFLKCFKALYQPGTYYVDLFLAWERNETDTEFFNDYGLQAVRCRKIGSLGGTTNPAISVMGEDDYDGKGNIHGQPATDFITSSPNKWREVRKVIAKEQIKLGEADDWGGTAFTEWVVVDAMLGLRSLFLHEGLGRVAFQLRPDWHCDEEKLTRGGGQIFDILGKRVSVFDSILMEGTAAPYTDLVASRLGKPNNHFKIACTSQVALDVVKAFNAGNHPKYPGAVKERMFTNMTLSYEVPQMVATSVAVEEGIADYEARTGEKVDDGRGGSVVTSMIGRFNDAIRVYRIEQLLAALPSDSKFAAEIKPAAVKALTDAPLNCAEFVAEVAKAGIAYDPETEEDAIDHAGSLATKRTVMYLEQRYGRRSRILTASKRKFHQNTDLLNVPFSTDFGNIQRMYLDLKLGGGCKVDAWKSIYDGMNEDGTPAAGSVWAKRSEVLASIWPDWVKAFMVDGVKPEDYISTIYVPPTLNQFLGFWDENVSRAKTARESVQ